MRQIGMLVAVELDSVLRRYGSPENAEELGGFRVFNYRMDGYELHVINSGVGELAAAAATQLLIGHYRAELVVNFGVVEGGRALHVQPRRSHRGDGPGPHRDRGEAGPLRL